MTSRPPVLVLLAVAVHVVALASLHGMPRPDHEGVDPLPVHGSVMPAGHFVGTLQIVAGNLDAAGQLRVTGLLSGTATRRTGVEITVMEQPFTAPAILHDAGHTTDVVNLALAPIALDPSGVRVRLAPITVDIEALPDMGDALEPLMQPSSSRRTQGERVAAQLTDRLLTCFEGCEPRPGV